MTWNNIKNWYNLFSWFNQSWEYNFSNIRKVKAPLDNSVRTIRTLNRNQSQKDWFFCCIKNQPTLKRKVGEKMKHYKMYKSIMKYLTDTNINKC